jgi:O-antigen/teichoic acid export membrane protein
MGLRLAVSFGAMQAAAAMATSFLSVKITSVVLGPAGLGVLGQFQSLVALSQGVLAAGVTTAVVRRTAQDGGRRAVIVSSALRLLLLGGVPIAVLIAAGSGPLARELLHDPLLRAPLLLFAVLYLAGLAAGPVLGCANGARDYQATTLIQAGAGLAGLGLLAALCLPWGVAGALAAAAATPAATSAVAWTVARRRAWWPGPRPAAAASAPEMRAIAAFLPMAAVGAATVPLIQLLVRDQLAAHSGMPSVGLLQGVTRLSDLYFGVVASLVGMHFLPRFAELRRADELRRELKRALLLVLPPVCAVGLGLYLARDWVVLLVFSSAFADMRDLFGWQMAGNVMKTLGWLLGSLLLARTHPLAMAGFELATGLLWWQAAVHFIDARGAVGATQAYAATYAAYAAVAAVAIAWMLARMARAEREGVP